MKSTTCLIAFCLILGAAMLTEANNNNNNNNNNKYSTTKAATAKPYTTRAARTRRTRQTTKAQTTKVYTTQRKTTQAPVVYTTTTRRTTTTTTTRRTTTTTRHTTTTTYKKPVTQTYTTRRQTTVHYTTRRQTTPHYTTRRQTTPHYTTRHTTTTYATPTYTYTSSDTTTQTTTETTTQTTTQTTTNSEGLSEVDIAILNFALNLEYLEAEFYCAAIGRTPSYTGEVGGTVTGGEVVNFTTPEFRQYAEELATDEESHVVFLRRVLGDRAADRPDINIAGGVNGSFGQAAQAAGALAGVNQASQDALGTFSPYTNELYFLHGAFIFEDVGVTAYKGAISSLDNKDAISSAAGILAVEGYHAGQIRTLLYGVRRTIAIAANAVNGSSPLRVRDIVGAISGLRASLDGSDNGGHDQSIVTEDEDGSGSGSGSGSGDDEGTANIVPADEDSIAFGRTAREILNIVYGSQGATMGLFFPNGVNGDFSALL